MPSRVTLLTDFGTRDGYSGAMKGVIASIAPDAIIDDITHDLEFGDTRAAAWSLGAYWHRYPKGTVHIAIVDPGVGSERRAIAARVDGRYVVAPDNGIITFLLDDARDVVLREIPASAAAAPTFHGRDVFAPAAARLAAGESFEDLGPLINDPVVIVIPAPDVSEKAIIGAIIHVDRYGNLITNIRDASPTHAVIGGVSLPVRRTYSDVEQGEGVALVGSRGYVEISIRDGNAARALGLGLGDPVELRSSTAG